MLLTITYTGKNTQDLGYLLHKNPARPQEFQLPMGKAYVFYPDISDEKTTAALMLDLNPLHISRGKPGTRHGRLSDYVNDRPYTASSFLSSAISKVFNAAMSGRCEKRQELADRPLNLTACVYMLPVREDKKILKEIFEPLGYELCYERFPVDERFPEWGESPYVNLAISGKVRLADLLRHLYVLIPVFDRQKHYFVSKEEINKLLLHGAGWLEDHPAKERIIRRYFAKAGSYADIAIRRLIEENGIEDSGEYSNRPENQFLPLDKMRLDAVRQEVLQSGASSVIDLGCGEGKLLELLLPAKEIQKLCGVDVSADVLERARRRLFCEERPWQQVKRLELFQGSLVYEDKRFFGFDAACVVEVVEHIPQEKLGIFEKVLFQNAAPHTVILTTPNREYNVRYRNSSGQIRRSHRGNAEGLRHSDHWFEWDREGFTAWTVHICEKYGYEAKIKGIGEEDSRYGFPTQMGVFTKCR